MTQKPLKTQKHKFAHDMGAYECFTQTEFGGARLRYVTKIFLAEHGQKVDEYESIYLGNYQY